MGKAASKEKRGGGNGQGTDQQKVPVEVEVPFDQYAFPFENAVFEGGPLVSLAYLGAVRVSSLIAICRPILCICMYSV